MRWVWTGLALLGLTVIALSVYVRTRPQGIAVARSRTIDASPERLFGLIEDLHSWPQWAPQDRDDATLKRTYSGALRGAGAQSDWTSQGRGGSGHLAVVRADAAREVVVQVDFSRPFVAHNLNTFTLEPAGSGTRLTWSMQGSNPLLLRLMSLFSSPDRMLGAHFEAGLANLAALAQHAPAPEEGSGSEVRR
jgi:uncharacterized protein YndB with AHSA1/START domain